MAHLLRAFSLLPKAMVSWLGIVLGNLAWVLARKERRTLQRNVARVFNLPAHSAFARLFGRQVSRHQASAALESIKGVVDGHSLSFIGAAALQENIQIAKASGRGVIVVTAHLGSWELVAYAVAKALHRLNAEPIYVLAKPPQYLFLRHFLEAFRVRLGSVMLWTDRKSLLRDMLGVLKGGGVLGFVMDQKPMGRQGPVVDFFGLPTAFVSGPANLGLRTGAAALAVFCVRVGPFQYRLYSELLVPAATQGLDEQAFTQILSTAIEKYIRLFPEQWTWNYRRWSFAKAHEKSTVAASVAPSEPPSSGL